MKYTRELARIKATQKAYEYRHHWRPTQKPLSFSQWFLQGIRQFEAKGAEFKLLPGMVKIVWSGKTAILRTKEDFEGEYENMFLFVKTGKFEECKGATAWVSPMK
jgi:hypothetical protein